MELDTRDILTKFSRTVNAIRRMHAPCDRSDLSSQLSISWAGIDKHIKVLLDAGIIEETDGKKYQIVKNRAYSVGIAIGTRSIKTSIVNFALEPVDVKAFVSDKLPGRLEQFQTAHPHGDFSCHDTPKELDSFIALLNDMLEILLDAFADSSDLAGITIAFPGAVDIEKQRIVACPNIPYLSGKNITTLVRGVLLNRIENKEIALLVDHNAKTSLIAERERLYYPEDENHNLADIKDFAVVYGGTGFGCAIASDGVLIRGRGFAGELGHLTAPDYCTPSKQPFGVDDFPVVCSCTRLDCLEALMRARVFGAKTLEDYIDNTREDILEHFQEQHKEEYEVFLKYVSFITNHLINLLGLEAIIFTGRLFQMMQDFSYDLEMIKGKSTLTYTGTKCSVVLSWKRTDIAAIGAAMEVFLTNGERSAKISW